MVRKGFLIPQTPSHVTFFVFFLKWVFFLLFFQWKQLFLESRLKGPLLVTDNSETQCSSKSLQPFNPEIPLSAAWPSWIACAAEQIPSLIPSSLCKIKIHHRHGTGYSFVLETGSDIAICGWEQWVEVTEPAFQEIPKQGQDGWKAADAQLCNAEDLHWFQQLYIQIQPSPVSGLSPVQCQGTGDSSASQVKPNTGIC